MHCCDCLWIFAVPKEQHRKATSMMQIWYFYLETSIFLTTSAGLITNTGGKSLPEVLTILDFCQTWQEWGPSYSLRTRQTTSQEQTYHLQNCHLYCVSDTPLWNFYGPLSLFFISSPQTHPLNYTRTIKPDAFHSEIQSFWKVPTVFWSFLLLLTICI